MLDVHAMNNLPLSKPNPPLTLYMNETSLNGGHENAQIMLRLLDSVERNGNQTQRRLASELGIALGLVNAYLNRCVNKGLLKARHAPARRYVYYLTPRGFAEKSRLTVQYLSYSFGFFRQAKADCSALMVRARTSGFNRVAFAGKSDLAEIAALCAIETGIEVVAVVEPSVEGSRFVGIPLTQTFDGIEDQIDAVIVTDLVSATKTHSGLVSRFGNSRVLVPDLLRLRLGRMAELGK